MKLLMNGWDLGGDRNAIWLRNIERTVKFDIKIKTKEGIIFAMYTNWYFPTQEVSATGADYRMKVKINKANEFLGHMNEDAIRAAAKELGW